MRRAYYLSDGTLQVVSGGGFRDLEESEHTVITRTREVIVHGEVRISTGPSGCFSTGVAASALHELCSNFKVVVQELHMS